ncbi:MAG TPA: hypothetical protein VFZ45_04445, partial [Actinomycetota bacterium]|nr:hypothetical protein [Actinomycetota bacterium]
YGDSDAVLDRLFDRAEVAVAPRAGEALDVAADAARWSDLIRTVRLPPEVAAVSSRAIREAVRAGEDVSASVPPEVLAFLEG